MTFGADFETDTGNSGSIRINCHCPSASAKQLIRGVIRTQEAAILTRRLIQMAKKLHCKIVVLFRIGTNEHRRAHLYIMASIHEICLTKHA